MRPCTRHVLLTLIALVITAPAFADSGMWTFQDFPAEVRAEPRSLDAIAANQEKFR